MTRFVVDGSAVLHLASAGIEVPGERYGEQWYIDAMEYVQSAEFFPSG